MDRSTGDWQNELVWITQKCKDKVWRAAFLKCVVAETIYAAWRFRNETVFGTYVHSIIVEELIIERIIYRIWYNKKLRNNLVTLMI